MISALTNTATQHMFYEVPIPLIIGNLPVGNFKQHLHEYDYLKIFKVPSQDKCIYWSKFHNNYIMKKLDRIDYMFPNIEVNSDIYAVNPFMNDINGICSWKNNDIHKISKIYYNTETSKYEAGFGQDVCDYDGFLYSLNSKDYTFTTTEDVSIRWFIYI